MRKSGEARPSWDEYYLELCDVVSQRATCSRLYVGSVIVKEHRIISVGYNGSLPGMVHCDQRRCIICGWEDPEPELIPRDKYLPPSECPNCGLGTVYGGHLIVEGHCLRTCHAEENAIVYAARAGIALEGAVLYCTTMPCWNCLKLCVGAGIKEVIYKNDYDVSGNLAIQDFLRQKPFTLGNRFLLTKWKSEEENDPTRESTDDSPEYPPGD